MGGICSREKIDQFENAAAAVSDGLERASAAADKLNQLLKVSSAIVQTVAPNSEAAKQINNILTQFEEHKATFNELKDLVLPKEVLDSFKNLQDVNGDGRIDEKDLLLTISTSSNAHRVIDKLFDATKGHKDARKIGRFLKLCRQTINITQTELDNEVERRNTPQDAIPDLNFGRVNNFENHITVTEANSNLTRTLKPGMR